MSKSADKVIYELQRNFSAKSKMYRIYFIIISISVCSIVTYAVFWIAPPLSGFRGLFLVLFWLVIFYIFLSGILKLFNFKRLYITDSYLVIDKYIGKKIMLQLGSFYAHSMRFSNPTSPKLTNNLCFTTFLENKEFVIDESNLCYTDNTQNIHELIDKLNVLFKPHITQYLLSLSEEKYSQIFNDIFIKNEILYFDEIEKLRKEKENGKEKYL